MIDADKRKAVFLLHQEGMGRNQIARHLRISPNTVRVIIDQKGKMPARTRSDKIQIDSDLLKRLYEECEGFAQRVHEKLVEEEHIAVKYSTLTRILRQLGMSRSGEPRSNHLLDHVSDAMRSADGVREWLLDLINGKRSVESIQVEIPDADVQFLFFQLKHGRSRQRKKAATILARKRGIPNSVIAKAIQSSCSTIRRYYRMYIEAGLETLFTWNTNRRFGNQCKVSERTKRILELLHHKPASYGINRTNWTQPALLKAYEQSYGEVISRSALAKIIRRTGYRWRKAQRVLTSPDPSYHEKVELLLKTLRCLGTDEMFFFLDEWGPVQVRKRGGKAYRTDHATIPRRQVSRGSVSLIAALSATTNHVTWHFLESKDSHAMMDMIEILYNQYHTKTKLYITWDAVAWHNSGPLLEALDQFNEETRALSVGPIIQLVPLPTSSQFLNVIEGVLSGMTRAVINNSDYPNAAQMKQAISKHFTERNEHFKHNPRRVVKKIWEFDFFQDFDALRSGNYKDW
jgi:transposase